MEANGHDGWFQHDARILPGQTPGQKLCGVAGRVQLHVWKVFGMTFFGAAGEVASKMEDLAFNQLKFSGGGGLRFEVDKNERVNIRFDIGFSKSGPPGYYLTIGEAF